MKNIILQAKAVITLGEPSSPVTFLTSVNKIKTDILKLTSLAIELINYELYILTDCADEMIN